MDWDTYFHKLADLVASKSKDQNTQIGAVIVGPGNEIRSTGYNSFVRGLNDDVPERHARPEKYFWFEHGERNAIYNAARSGVSTVGCTIYLNCGCPCADCARAIIQAGIVEVVMGRPQSSNSKWAESAERSRQMFHECGVKLRLNLAVAQAEVLGKLEAEKTATAKSEIDLTTPIACTQCNGTGKLSISMGYAGRYSYHQQQTDCGQCDGTGIISNAKS